MRWKARDLIRSFPGTFGSQPPLSPSYRVLQKKTYTCGWTVLEHQEELDAVLWRAFTIRLPESEIARKVSENDFSSRTRNFAAKRCFST